MELEHMDHLSQMPRCLHLMPSLTLVVALMLGCAKPQSATQLGQSDRSDKEEGLMDAPNNRQVIPKLTKDQIESIATDYMSKVRCWPRTVYTIEHRQDRDKSGNYVVNIVHEDDKKSEATGGKSLELHIDPTSKIVVAEYGFQ